jgi:type VI secretion system secreted protein Hcp
MKKWYILFSISLIILLLLSLVTGCKPQTEMAPEAPDITTAPAPAPAPAAEPAPSPEPEIADGEAEESPELPMHSSAYIKFEGIDGESQDTGHEGWSEIISFSQGISVPGAGTTTTTRRRGDVIFGDVVVIKQVDKSSPKLAEYMTKGTLLTKVEIHLTGPSEGSPCQGTFYVCELKNAHITSYVVSGSNPLAHALIAPAPEVTTPSSGPFIVQAVDAPMEEISINFEEIKVTYTECDSSGKAKGNVEYSFKVEEGES